MKLEINEDFLKTLPSSNNVFDQLMQMNGKIYRQVTGRETLRFPQAGRHYFIKKHFGVGWREIFKNLSQFRLPIIGAKNELQAIEGLANRNILVPEILAFGERGVNPAKKQSFIVTGALEDCISLEDLCRDWPKQRPAFSMKQALISKVASIAKTMHDGGINHRDFYICHFLWHREGDELYLIDLHRAQIRDQVPRRWLEKDLSGLYFSAMDIGLTKKDLLRFIQVYFKKPWRVVINEQKQLLANVEKKARALYEKEFGKLPMIEEYF